MSYLRQSARIENPAVERELTEALVEVSRKYGNNLRRFFVELSQARPESDRKATDSQLPSHAQSALIGKVAR
jgi:hypothetical protein